VHKGFWTQEGTQVAIKRVSRKKLTPEENKAIQAEVNLFKSLHNKYVVSYIEAVESDPEYLDIVMEFVEGGSLDKLVTEVRKNRNLSDDSALVLDESLVAKFVSQLLMGLSYLHKQGIIHRDIKGGNLLITKDSHVKLTDFGVSTTRPVESSSDSSTEIDVVGTPYWMAPEIISLSGFSTASDIWSVGCTVIELLTGFPPYHELNELAAMFRIVSDDRPPLPSNISAELEDFLMKCFNKDMYTRASADHLLQHKWIQQVIANVTTRNNEQQQQQLTSKASLNADKVTRTSTLVNRDLLIDPKQAIAAFSEDTEELTYDDLDVLSDFAEDEEAESHSHVNQSHRDDFHEEVVSAVDPFDDALFDDPVAEREQERMRASKEKWDRIKYQMQRLLSSDLLDNDSVVSSTNIVCQILHEYPDQCDHLVQNPGLYGLLELLSLGKHNEVITHSILRILSELTRDHYHEQQQQQQQLGVSSHSLDTAARIDTLFDMRYNHEKSLVGIQMEVCITGFLPHLITFFSSQYSQEIREQAASIIHSLIKQEATLQMFVSCGGVTSVIQLLEPDLSNYMQLTTVALDTFSACFNILGQRYRQTTCRCLAMAGCLPKIGASISWILEHLHGGSHPQEVLVGVLKRCAQLLQIMAERPDGKIKAALTDECVLAPIKNVLKRKDDVSVEIIELLLLVIQDVSRDPVTHSPLTQAGLISPMVDLLSWKCATSMVQKPIIVTLYYLSIVSPQRQEAIVLAGVIPFLQERYRANDINLKGYSVEIYAGLGSNSSDRVKDALWEYDGLQFYMELLAASDVLTQWRTKILGSITEWLEKDRVRVESVLVKDKNTLIMKTLFDEWPEAGIELLLDVYRQLIGLSVRYSRAMEESGVLNVLVSWLQNRSVSRPFVQVLILRVIGNHMDNTLDVSRLAHNLDLVKVLHSVTSSAPAVTVSQLALELLDRLGVDTTLVSASNNSSGVSSSSLGMLSSAADNDEQNTKSITKNRSDASSPVLLEEQHVSSQVCLDGEEPSSGHHSLQRSDSELRFLQALEEITLTEDLQSMGIASTSSASELRFYSEFNSRHNADENDDAFNTQRTQHAFEHAPSAHSGGEPEEFSDWSE